MDKYAVSIPKRFQLVTLDAGGKFQNSQTKKEQQVFSCQKHYL